MSLDKFVARGFTASTGGGLDNWVSKATPATGSAPSSHLQGSGSSFVMGGGQSSRSGSSRVSEAMGARGSGQQSRKGLSQDGGRGPSHGSGADFERRSFSEDLISYLFPRSDPRAVLGILLVLGLTAAGYILMRVGGFASDSGADGYGRAVQSELSERRERLR